AAKKLHSKQDKKIRAKQHREATQTGTPLLAKTHKAMDLQLHWTPGHKDFGPNKRADAVAKEAAGGLSSPPNTLPTFLRHPPPPNKHLGYTSAPHHSLAEAVEVKMEVIPLIHTHEGNRQIPPLKILH
ncbi:hypothetical protein C0991_001321, partial [Blastosporella zonata]